jgi:hypothetical protein
MHALSSVRSRPKIQNRLSPVNSEYYDILPASVHHAGEGNASYITPYILISANKVSMDSVRMFRFVNYCHIQMALMWQQTMMKFDTKQTDDESDDLCIYILTLISSYPTHIYVFVRHIIVKHFTPCVVYIVGDIARVIICLYLKHAYNASLDWSSIGD